MNEPMRMPSTSMTPQSMSSVSPVARYPVRFAEGVVMAQPGVAPRGRRQGPGDRGDDADDHGRGEGIPPLLREQMCQSALPGRQRGHRGLELARVMDCQPDGDGRDEDDEDP